MFAAPRLATVIFFFQRDTFLTARAFLDGAGFALAGAGLAAARMAAAVFVVVDDRLAATGVLNFLVNDLTVVVVAVVLGLAMAVVALVVYGPSQHGTDKVRPSKNSTSFVANILFFGGSLTRPEGPV